MSCPLLADSLSLDTWSTADFKVSAKSKQRYIPIYASGKNATFKLSSETLLCPWGINKFQDIDSGRVAIEVFLNNADTIAAIEK